jgi:ABC-type transporter Mla subunit MlaD
MKSLIFLTSVLFLFALTAAAQNKVDNAVNKANNSVNSVNASAANANAAATNAVNTAANTAGQAKDIANKVNGLLGKKPADGGPANTTLISVKGANFATLKKLNESIMDCPGVQDSKMKFNSAESTITVIHAGSTSKLLKQIQKKTTLISDDNINDFDEGKISVTLKQ